MSCKTYDPCRSNNLNQVSSYASTAGQYAQQAQQSATNAATSATQASTAQAEAEQYAIQAAASAAISGIYLGAKSTAPVVDNQGNPLQEGMQYFNSVDNTMYVWDGTSWITATGFNETTNFLATATTTARDLQERLADVVNVKDFGAVGDGVADDTAAIQAAIDAVNDWSVFVLGGIGNNDGSTPDYKRGGLVKFPNGVYRITSPILLAPSIILEGDGLTKDTNQSTLVENSGKKRTTILCDFPEGNKWYMFDTGNWRRKEYIGGPVIQNPYRVISSDDLFPNFEDKDDWTGAMCPSVSIRGLYLEGNKKAFGGIRMQIWFYGKIEYCTINNCEYCAIQINSSFEWSIGDIHINATPIGISMQGCASGMFVGSEVTIYNKASESWKSSNQQLINDVFYSQIVNFNNPSFDNIRNSWYNLNLKGITAQWCPQLTIQNLGIQKTNIGVELYKSNANILHWENEFIDDGVLFHIGDSSFCVCDAFSTKSNVPLSTGHPNSRLILRSPWFIACTTSFTPWNGETVSKFQVDIHDFASQDQINSYIVKLSSVNRTKIYNAWIVAGIFVPPTDDPEISLYVNNTGSEVGSLKDNAFTMESALRFIENNQHIHRWKLILSDDQDHIIEDDKTFKNLSIRFVRQFNSSSKPTISFDKQITLLDCTIIFEFTGVTTIKPGSTINSIFKVIGNCKFYLQDGHFAIPDNKVIAQSNPTQYAEVYFGGYGYIGFGTLSGMVAGATNMFLSYRDTLSLWGSSGSLAIEGITSGRVIKEHSVIVP